MARQASTNRLSCIIFTQLTVQTVAEACSNATTTASPQFHQLIEILYF